MPKLNQRASITPAATTTPTTDAGIPQYGVDFVPDIDFAVKDPAVIQTEVIADYQAAFLALTNIAKTLAPGDPVRLHLLVICDWLSQQRVIIDFTGKSNLLKYAQNAFLDNLAALHGDRTLRLQPSPALCTLEFTLTAPLAFDAAIAQGTLCLAPNGIAFATDADAVLIAGQSAVDVTATCTTAGTIGNGFTPGQISGIINWNQPYALGVSNLDTTAGGGDLETDDQYRYRVWLAIESYSIAGPHDAYEFWALSANPDIIQCVVYSAPAIAGEVWLYPLLRGGQLPTQEILAEVVATCSANTRRPLTDYVTAYAPTVFTYTLNLDWYLLTDNEVLLSTIQTNVQQAVSDWILWQRSYVGRDINGDELIKRCLEAGAKRVVINSPSPSYQVMGYNQLACHDDTIAPIINYVGTEDP